VQKEESGTSFEAVSGEAVLGETTDAVLGSAERYVVRRWS
jgi:hypothetical protein